MPASGWTVSSQIAAPAAPGLAQKYIRIKRVKGQRRPRPARQRLREGDTLQLYINDEFFDKPSEENMFLTLFKPRLTVVYEDEHLLLADKPQGLVVHADETEKVNTLINHIQAYLYQKREWNPPLGERLHPGPVQPHRPQHRRHRHRRQGRGDAAHPQRKIRDRELDKALPLRHRGPPPSSRRAAWSAFC